jgi:hypothetical protein
VFHLKRGSGCLQPGRIRGAQPLLGSIEDDACSEDPDYAKHTLKLVQESSIFALMGEQSGSTPK